MAESPDQQELNIKDEYELWRKNCKYMYEFINETALTWPSLTVQWLPTSDTADEAINARLLLGTHTSGEGQNHLKVASTQLPVKGSGKKVSSKIKITQKLECSSEVNRARYKPQTQISLPLLMGAVSLILQLEDEREIRTCGSPLPERIRFVVESV
ncbi:histone acetyltransferase type B subunit 2 [Candidozyma auris]|nr:histone acetyltransferase type B subunit 2 [[Candida] auris]